MKETCLFLKFTLKLIEKIVISIDEIWFHGTIWSCTIADSIGKLWIRKLDVSWRCRETNSFSLHLPFFIRFLQWNCNVVGFLSRLYGQHVWVLQISINVTCKRKFPFVCALNLIFSKVRAAPLPKLLMRCREMNEVRNCFLASLVCSLSRSLSLIPPQRRPRLVNLSNLMNTLYFSNTSPFQHVCFYRV